MGSGQPSDFGQLARYMYPNLVLTPEQADNAKKQAEFLEKAAAIVRQKAEEGSRRYQREQLRKQIEEGERARQQLASLEQDDAPTHSIPVRTPSADNATRQTGLFYTANHFNPESTARIEEIPASSSHSETSQYHQHQRSSNVYNSSGQSHPQPAHYAQQPPVQRNLASTSSVPLYNAGLQHLTNDQLAQLPLDIRQQSAHYLSNSTADGRMRDRPTPGHTQARTQAPPRYPPNALAQNAAQGPSPRLAQTQNTPQTQNNQHNQTQNNQHNQAQKSTQHQGWIHYGTQSQSQPQTYSNPRSQLSHHYQPQEMQRPWRQEQPSYLGQTSTEHYRHEQDLPTRISAGLAHYRPNTSATATSIGPSPTAAGPSLTSTGNFSSSLQGGLGQQTARANAEASRGSSLNTAVQSHNPNLSSVSTRTQQRNSVDSTQSSGQSTALTIRPIAPVLQGDFRRISTSTSQDSDRTHRMQDISAATNGGISRDTAIAIPLDVDSTLPVDPNRTVSNTRHLNPQLANTAPTTTAQNNIHHTANTKPGDDAIYLVPPSQSFFQARISEPSPFAQSAPSHNEPNGNSWNMPISPAHTSVSGSDPRTPASVNKKLLARDILRSFGRGDILSSLGGKRKRSEDRQPPDMSGKRARDKSPASSAQIASPLPAVAPVLVISDTTDEPQMAQLAEEEEEADVQLIETMVTSPGLNLVRSADTQPDKSPQVSVATGAGVSMTPAVTASDLYLVAEPPKTREPLFLPSPTSSLHEVDMDQSHESQPLAHPQQGSDDAATSHIPVYTHYYEPHPEWPAEEVKPTLPSRCFVKVPEAPEWVKLYNQGRKERAEKSRRRRPSPIVISDSEDEIEQWEGEGEEGGKPSQRGNKIGADAEERRQDEIVEQSTSAIRPQPPCKWKHCNVVMNSGNNLIAHLETHLRGMEAPYTCCWQSCIQRDFFDKDRLLVHLKNHVLRGLLHCPYQECEESCLNSEQLLKHCDEEHQHDNLRPEPVPSKPTEPSLPAIPSRVPSYQALVDTNVSQTPITKERHAVLGPWVLRNIFGPVSLRPKRHNAAVSLRNIINSSRDKSDIAPDEYDFLISHARAPAPDLRLDDLASEEVSRLVDAGLTLWGPEEYGYDTHMKVEDSPTKDVVFLTKLPLS